MSQNMNDVAPPQLTRRQTVQQFWDRILQQTAGLTARFGGRAENGAAIGEGPALASLVSPSARERWNGAAALGRNSQRTPEALAALAAALADPEEFVRWQAAQALATQEPGQAYPLLSSLLEDVEPLKRAGAATALGLLGGEAAALTLTRHLGEADPLVRTAIIEAIGEAGDAARAPALLPFVEDADANVRRSTAHSLGRLGNPESCDALAALLVRPGEPLLVRRAAAAALLRVARPEAQPQLLIALADPDPQVRAYVARVLGQVGAEQSVAALTALSSDRTPVLKGTVSDAAREALTLLEQRGRRSAEGPAAEAKRPA